MDSDIEEGPADQELGLVENDMQFSEDPVEEEQGCDRQPQEEFIENLKEQTETFSIILNQGNGLHNEQQINEAIRALQNTFQIAEKSKYLNSQINNQELRSRQSALKDECQKISENLRDHCCTQELGQDIQTFQQEFYKFIEKFNEYRLKQNRRKAVRARKQKEKKIQQQPLVHLEQEQVLPVMHVVKQLGPEIKNQCIINEIEVLNSNVNILIHQGVQTIVVTQQCLRSMMTLWNDFICCYKWQLQNGNQYIVPQTNLLSIVGTNIDKQNPKFVIDVDKNGNLCQDLLTIIIPHQNHSIMHQEMNEIEHSKVSIQSCFMDREPSNRQSYNLDTKQKGKQKPKDKASQQETRRLVCPPQKFGDPPVKANVSNANPRFEKAFNKESLIQEVYRMLQGDTAQNPALKYEQDLEQQGAQGETALEEKQLIEKHPTEIKQGSDVQGDPPFDTRLVVRAIPEKRKTLLEENEEQKMSTEISMPNTDDLQCDDADELGESSSDNSETEFDVTQNFGETNDHACDFWQSKNPKAQTNFE